LIGCSHTGNNLSKTEISGQAVVYSQTIF